MAEVVRVVTSTSTGNPGTDSNQAGTWKYYAGASGTVTVGANERVIGISAHCTTAGSMTIAGGASITIPANTALSIAPLGNVTAPSIVFTGTDAYFVETVV